MRTRRRDERGISLIELLVAMAVTLVIGTATMKFFSSSIASSAELQQATQLHAEARLAIDQLVGELRQAYTGDPILPAVTAIGTHTITFHSPDAAEHMQLRRISYKVEDGTLQRRVTRSNQLDGPPWTFPPVDGPWVAVMEVEDAAAFEARDASRALTTDPAAVREVAIRLTGSNVGDRRDMDFQTTVQLRSAR